MNPGFSELKLILILFVLNRIQQLFMELLSNSRQLRWLSCSFMLGLVTPCSLACLSNPSAETLQHLSLLDHQLGLCLPLASLRLVVLVVLNCLVSFRSPHLTVRTGSSLQHSLSGFGFF